jgi:formylglycine-generating enzyme required for sulfatase activity
VILILFPGLLVAAAPPSEPLPGPAWGVYLPLAATDAAGITDPGKKCHWFEKRDADGAVVGGAWYTHLVMKDGVPITDNADPAIWAGDAVLSLRRRPNNPQELEPVLEGQPLSEADGYVVMRMVLLRPGQDAMPPNPVQIGSPLAEPARRANEDRIRTSIPAAYWLAAEECHQGLWKQIMAGLHPVDPGAVDHDAALSAALTADNLPVAEFLDWLQPEIYLSYEDTLAFCARASTTLGTTVRLPSESEWEYACRAGRPTAFNTERGYTLRGPQWEVATTDTPPTVVQQEDYDDYFAKVNLKVQGPFDLTRSRFFVAGTWEEHLHTVRFESTGEIVIQQDFTALAEVEANFDSRYRRWYRRIYAFDWQTYDGSSAWFSVQPETLLDTQQDLRIELGRPAGMVAYDDRHLAQVVRGLFMPVDAEGRYTVDETAIADFRQVVDGIVPRGLLPSAGDPLVYYHQAEYDNQGIFLASPLPDEETFFKEADEDIKAAILSLPLGDPPSTASADLAEQVSAAIEQAKKRPSHAYVNWGLSTFDQSVTIDLGGLDAADKRGRFALRNRWGIANAQGSGAEGCVQLALGQPNDPGRRWNGEAGYADASGYSTAGELPEKRYAVIRGGSFHVGADRCRSAVRSPAIPLERRPQIGFRFLIED